MVVLKFDTMKINQIYYNLYQGTDVNTFMAGIQVIAERLGIQPEWLLNVMIIESGLNPQAVNGSTGASGLIQFMPATAKNLGTNVENIRLMTAVEQLDYVYEYLKPYRGKMRSWYDVYFAVFYPAAIGKADSWVLQSSSQSAAIIAKYNKGYDRDGNNAITVAEVKESIDIALKKKGCSL